MIYSWLMSRDQMVTQLRVEHEKTVIVDKKTRNVNADKEEQ